MSEATVPQQLRLLKAITVRTGAIHDAQALQLKIWPTLIPNVTHSVALVDANKKSVKYVCQSSGLRPSKKMRLLCEHICEWTRTILWNETKVVIEINKKKVFDSSVK